MLENKFYFKNLIFTNLDRAEDVQSVGGRIWTIDGHDEKNPEDTMSLTEDDETRILLEKEFDDYYEDHVHKSAVCFYF